MTWLFSVCSGLFIPNPRELWHPSIQCMHTCTHARRQTDVYTHTYIHTYIHKVALCKTWRLNAYANNVRISAVWSGPSLIAYTIIVYCSNLPVKSEDFGYPKFRHRQAWANSVDPDQDLRCPNIYVKYGLVWVDWSANLDLSCSHHTLRPII